MTRIMFVCHGNICRSPLAEGVFNHLAARRTMAHTIEAHSSGVARYHVGEAADIRSIHVAQRHGVALTGRAQQFQPQHFSYNLILTMDASNYSDVCAQATPAQQERVHMFRRYDPEAQEGAEVPDPYYGGARGFENVYQMIARTCKEILNRVESGTLKIYPATEAL